MSIPKELKYTNNHEWIRVEGETAFVGITDFAQSQLGDIVYVDITSLGDSLGQNECFGSIEAVKTVAEAFMPVSGEVLEANEAIDGQPDLINTDPYGAGWIIKIKIANAAELDSLLSAEQYEALIADH